MKKLLFSMILTGSVLYFGCEKSAYQTSSSSLSVADQKFVASAKKQFANDIGNLLLDTGNLNPRLRTLKNPIWEKAVVKIFKDVKMVVIPLIFKRNFSIRSGLDYNRLYQINDMAKLVIYQDSSRQFHEEVITSFPDSNYLRSGDPTFSGILKIETWQGSFLRTYKYSSGTITALSDSKANTGKSENGAGKVIVEKVAPSEFASVSVCYTADFYNYSVEDPEDGYYYSEDLGCQITTFGNTGGGNGPSAKDYGGVSGGGGSGGTTGNNSIVDSKGTKTINNVQDYTKCFHNSPKIAYSIGVMVDEPIPGSKATYSSTLDNGSSGMNVGHVFLVFTQNQGGIIIRRAMGFYPSGPVTPVTPSSHGSLNDDESHPFDVSVTVPVSGQSFMNILNSFSNGSNALYNLNSNNCSTWALSALANGGINIPAQQGTWPFGGGDDPGDMGEYIRNMQLPAGWSRNNSGGNAQSNTGDCNQP